MADYGHYFDLLARAIARFKADTSEARQQIYERARRAQSLHLQNFDPMFSDSEIDRQRNALEEAIRRVETAASEQPTIIEAWQMLLLPQAAEVSESRTELDDPVGFWQQLVESTRNVRDALFMCIVDRKFVDIAAAKAMLLARWRQWREWVRRRLNGD